MIKVSRIWLWVALVLFGFAGGIVVGVVVDVDNVYETTIKNIKQRRSPGGIITIDQDTQVQPGKSKKEIRQTKREQKRNDRESRKNE